MALTYGFYNSSNGDRKYNAEQFGSIFDGLIKDGVYMDIGGQLMVKTANNGMQVNIQTGRAWFDHTWTLNDSIYAITLPSPEPLLDKYVAIVLETNKNENYRRNSFTTVVGTPSLNPTYPALTNNDKVKQHPLAYVLVKAGATVISQANIVNMVGTSQCPYVIGVLQSMNVDNLIAQWQTQWNQWLSSANTSYQSLVNTTNRLISEFTSFMTSSNNEFSSFMSSSRAEVTQIETTFQTECNEIKNNAVDSFNQLVNIWNGRFQNNVTEMNTDLADYKNDIQTFISDMQDAFSDWFEHISGQLSEDAATNLQRQIDMLIYTYVDGERAILGVSASIVQEKVLFVAKTSLSGDKIILPISVTT